MSRVRKHTFIPSNYAVAAIRAHCYKPVNSEELYVPERLSQPPTRQSRSHRRAA